MKCIAPFCCYPKYIKVLDLNKTTENTETNKRCHALRAFIAN